MAGEEPFKILKNESLVHLHLPKNGQDLLIKCVLIKRNSNVFLKHTKILTFRVKENVCL